jgi:hypothetical protein
MAARGLSKQDVARRLIHAAIDMFEANADPLATHVVGSSAFNLLRELSKVGGTLFFERVFRSVLFDGAMKTLKGDESGLPEHPIVAEWVEGIARAIGAGHVRSPEDINVKDAPVAELDALKFLTGPFNFLKHADRDPDGILDESDVKAMEATSFAITAYSLLFPTDDLDPKVAEFLRKNAII